MLESQNLPQPSSQRCYPASAHQPVVLPEYGSPCSRNPKPCPSSETEAYQKREKRDVYQCSEVTNTSVGEPVHEQVMNWFTRSRTWSRNVIFLDYLVILFMSRSWTDHEVMNCSWTRALHTGIRVEHFFFRRQPQFFFVDFKNMVVKGTFTISGGKTPSIQQGFVTTWGQTNSQSTIFELRQISFLKNSLMKNSFIHCRFKSLVYHLRFHCSNYVQNYQTM